MELHEVKNMSFTDLKAKRTEILESFGDIPPVDMDAAFIAALTDAKGRDEKLAKQGKTITSLQDGFDAVKEQANAADRTSIAAEQRAREWKQKLDAALANAKTTEEENAKSMSVWRESMHTLATEARDAAAEQKRAFDEEVESLTAQMLRETERANRLKTEASRNHAAVSGAATLLYDAMAAQAVEDADRGE